jgi:TorA maturation chaperone TorD
LKYLQENDPELLNFDPKADVQSENEDKDDRMEEDEQIPVLTKDHLRKWQKALLDVCINKRICSFMLSLSNLATVTACPSKVVDCLPFCSPHE